MSTARGRGAPAPATEVIFSTIHGSHLYGMNHPGSDMDIFTVTLSARGARQTVRDGFDRVSVGWDNFLAYAASGSHQSLEAMFSPHKEWNERYEYYRVLVDNFRAGGSEVIAKYERTIKAFAHSGDFKRRRHAIRLWINLQDLRQYGRFDPTMTREQIAWATDMATSDLTGDALALLLTEGKSAMGNFLEVP